RWFGGAAAGRRGTVGEATPLGEWLAQYGLLGRGSRVAGANGRGVGEDWPGCSDRQHALRRGRPRRMKLRAAGRRVRRARFACPGEREGWEVRLPARGLRRGRSVQRIRCFTWNTAEAALCFGSKSATTVRPRSCRALPFQLDAIRGGRLGAFPTQRSNWRTCPSD